MAEISYNHQMQGEIIQMIVTPVSPSPLLIDGEQSIILDVHNPSGVARTFDVVTTAAPGPYAQHFLSCTWPFGTTLAIPAFQTVQITGSVKNDPNNPLPAGQNYSLHIQGTEVVS